MTTKRFHSEDNCTGYYTEIIDEQKKLDLTIPNPKKNLIIEELVDLLNELHEEVMNLRRENTKFKLIVSEIIEDMQKYIDDNQLVYINQSYVDWIKKEVDTTLYSQKKELEE